ncbi:uncharacterized protein LOC110107843, partial [Dendrobium catenatum]|uniref:uncharacterized protein LOC110107843 n=1 Tax=Dendrobium catenatum TaxID=906689 RepID=UPI0009F52F4C
RLQFLKFTIANTIAYWIRGAILPKACCAFISKLCSKFLLHGNIEDKKLHFIAWGCITKPKIYGGLCILSFDSLYFWVACSFIWRFFQLNSLVGSWFRAKYESPWKPPHPTASKFWKYIGSLALKIKPIIVQTVGQHCNFSFNWDPWVDGNRLADLCFDARFNHKNVGDFIVDGHWALPEFSPLQLCAAVSNIAILEQPALAWDGSFNPKFKQFTDLYYSNLEEVPWHKFIWFKKASLKFACFVWMALLEKLKCADRLIRFGIQISACDFSFSVLCAVNPIFERFLFRPNLFQSCVAGCCCWVGEFVRDDDELGASTG